ncbi:MAG: hypothetical protein JWO77_1539 [Ilumatobacteraceae bacterium]|nr:hypothetical protein [Ilumatobacteraceae bacterium]
MFYSGFGGRAAGAGVGGTPVGSRAVSDLTPSEPTPEPTPETVASNLGAEQELAIDLAAFLPDGVELGAETVVDDQIDATDEVPAAQPSAPPAPAVDLEALSQIERDLDAVDAAIAALEAGTYGLDPATGLPIDDALLAENPTRLS